MTVTKYIWDDLSDNVLVETDENGTVTAEYTNEPGLFGAPISQKRGDQNHFYHHDGDGSTRQVTDSDQVVTDSATYTGFGEVVSEAGSTVYPFRYKGIAGFYTDEETSEIYVRARTYLPRIGRWASQDPLGFVDGVNLYPPFFVPAQVDPSGLVQQEVHESPGCMFAALDWCGPDVTGWLLQQMIKSAMEPDIANPFTFYEFVRPGGFWDFKRRVSFRKGICPRNCSRSVTLCGFCFDHDVVGNIHYGYVGTIAGFDRAILTLAPGPVQEGGPWWWPFDDPQDTEAVWVGVDYANSRKKRSFCEIVRKKAFKLKTKNCQPCKIIF